MQEEYIHVSPVDVSTDTASGFPAAGTCKLQQQEEEEDDEEEENQTSYSNKLLALDGTKTTLCDVYVLQYTTLYRTWQVPKQLHLSSQQNGFLAHGFSHPSNPPPHK